MYVCRDNDLTHTHTPRAAHEGYTSAAHEGYTSATDAAILSPTVSPTPTVSGMTSGGKRGAGAYDAAGDHSTAVTVGDEFGGGGTPPFA